MNRTAPALLLACCMALPGGTANAQANWRELAVPYYGPEDFARGAAVAMAGRSAGFVDASQHLRATLTRHCAAPGANADDVRAAWRAAAVAWDGLAAFSTGALVERRSARRIDFMPARPELLARAIASAPRTLADMERIGAPARGFPALELMLWPSVPTPSSPACGYAVLVATDIEREALALRHAAQQRAQSPAEGEAAVADLVEAINQWVGGVEQLRWPFMRKPLEVAATRAAPSSDQTPGQSAAQSPAAVQADFPRHHSGQTAATWAARWATLRDTAVLGRRALPSGGAPLPFETLLRGRGLNPLADRLVSAISNADLALQGLGSEAAAPVRAAAAALGELTRLVQDELAPAVGVRLGFSDADGD